LPRVSRTRVIAVPRERVWTLVSDPHHIPRWWPRTQRVEDVRGAAGTKRTQWTTVLATERGVGVRADFRCVSAARPERYIWEQNLEGTPFERILRGATLEIRLDASGGGTAVTLASREWLRGLSRLGGLMMRRATRRRLDEALDGIELALVANGEG
jgi:uncharacterized protein YndB with AHSA1/START domain